MQQTQKAPTVSNLFNRGTSVTFPKVYVRSMEGFASLALFLLVLMGDTVPTNIPSTLAELEGTRLDISIMTPRGYEKPTFT